MLAASATALLVIFAGTASVTSLRVSQEPTAYPWASSGGGVAHEGAVKAPAPRALKTKPAWTFKEEVPKNALSSKFPSYSGLVRAPPLVDDNMNIYLSTVSSGSIYKISSEGKTLWSHKRGPGVRLPGVSVIMNGNLFAADSSGSVVSLDMKTGQLNWATQIGSVMEDGWTVAGANGIVLSPAINEDDLTFNPKNENNRVVAVHESNGSIAWKFDLEEEIEEARLFNPVFSIKEGSVVFSDSVGWIYRLDLKTGAVIWKTRSPGGRFENHGGGVIIAPPNNTVYLTWNQAGFEVNQITTSGNIGAYNWTNGKERWVNRLQFPVDGLAAVGYVGKGRGRQLTVVVGSGLRTDPRVQAKLKPGEKGRPLKNRVTGFVAEGFPFAGSYKFWRDFQPWYGNAAGDDARPDICAPKAVSDPTIGSDGSVYVGSHSGDLLTLHDEDEDTFFEDWEVDITPFGTAFAASPVILPGMLLATSCDGLQVWKFNSSAPPLVM